MVKKNTVKSFVRENKFHAYLTRETLPAEERVHIFHNHGKKSSCQTFADASMTKVVPKSFEALDGIEEKGPLCFETATECTIILVKSSTVVGKLDETAGPMVQFMEENSISVKHLGHLHEL